MKLLRPISNAIRGSLVGVSIETLLPTAQREAHARHREHFFAAPRTERMRPGRELMGRRIDGADVTYLVQNAQGIAPKRDTQVDGDLRATSWRRGKFTCVAVGPDASSGAWLGALTKH